MTVDNYGAKFGNVSRFIDYLTALIGCDEFEV